MGVAVAPRSDGDPDPSISPACLVPNLPCSERAASWKLATRPIPHPTRPRNGLGFLPPRSVRVVAVILGWHGKDLPPFCSEMKQPQRTTCVSAVDDVSRQVRRSLPSQGTNRCPAMRPRRAAAAEKIHRDGACNPETEDHQEISVVRNHAVAHDLLVRLFDSPSTTSLAFIAVSSGPRPRRGRAPFAAANGAQLSLPPRAETNAQPTGAGGAT